MAVRAHRTPQWSIDHLDPDDPDARASTTTLTPWRVAENHDVRWAIATRVPHYVWDHQLPTDDRPHHLLWLLDPTGDSWAVARYTSSPGPRQIRQHGPRPLWDEVEAAFRCWAAEGKPPLEQSALHVPYTEANRVPQSPAGQHPLRDGDPPKPHDLMLATDDAAW